MSELTTEAQGISEELEERAKRLPRASSMRELLTRAAEVARRLLDLAIRLDLKLVDAEAHVVGCKKDLTFCEDQLAKACLKTSAYPPERVRLSDVREGVTRRFALKHIRPHSCPSCAHQWEEQEEVRCYFTVNRYQDGKPGEVFIVTDRAGSMARGALDAVALVMSIGIQYGIPLNVFLDKMVGMRFGVGGYTGDKEVPKCTSVLDLLAKWIKLKFYSEPPKEGK